MIVSNHNRKVLIFLVVGTASFGMSLPVHAEAFEPQLADAVIAKTTDMLISDLANAEWLIPDDENASEVKRLRFSSIVVLDEVAHPVAYSEDDKPLLSLHFEKETPLSEINARLTQEFHYSLTYQEGVLFIVQNELPLLELEVKPPAENLLGISGVLNWLSKAVDQCDCETWIRETGFEYDGDLETLERITKTSFRISNTQNKIAIRDALNCVLQQCPARAIVRFLKGIPDKQFLPQNKSLHHYYGVHWGA